MKKNKIVSTIVLILVLSICLIFSSVVVSSAAEVLKPGMQGSSITVLQKNLKKLGFFSYNPTGYYGELTVSAVKNFQKRYKLEGDGIAGNTTLGVIQKLLNKTAVTVSRGEADRNAYKIAWFGGVENIFAIGTKATVYDIDTGLSFEVRRSYGYNHADCETLTAADTAIMKEIFGGQWNWDRRAIIVTVNGKKIAASMAGMPHAGRDDLPEDIYVKKRSDGYGTGINFDKVKGNDMSGHFDIHFYLSRTHCSNQLDDKHQSMVKKATDWAEKNF